MISPGLRADQLSSTAAYAPGDSADFERLYRTTYRRLVASVALVVGSVSEAEDCVQDAFCRAFRAWPAWRPEAPAEAWLWHITLNTARSHLRHRKLRKLPELLRRLGKPETLSADPQDLVADRDLVAALAALPVRDALAVVMRHHHGMSLQEVADALGVTVRSATRIVARGSASVRQQLETGGER